MILAVLVDRDPVMRLVAAAVTALRHDGVVATHVPDLPSLDATLRAVTPDLVVTDLTVTGRGPHDALSAVRAAWPGPLAALTGDDSPAAHSACVQLGAAHWLKPLTPREIADAVRAVNDRQPKVHP